MLTNKVYIHWVLLYLTANLSAAVPPETFSPSSISKLKFEKSIQMSRLLTVCEILLTDARSDQVCFLLMFLRRCIANQEKTWWRSRTKQLLKGIKKTRTGRLQWHVDFADNNISRLKGIEEHGEEPWSRRGSLMIDRGNYEMSKMKGD